MTWGLIEISVKSIFSIEAKVLHLIEFALCSLVLPKSGPADDVQAFVLPIRVQGWAHLSTIFRKVTGLIFSSSESSFWAPPFKK
jgi:hypothetical protein